MFDQVDSFASDGAEYLDNEKIKTFARMQGISFADALTFLGGKGFADGAQKSILSKLGGQLLPGGAGGGPIGTLQRFAGSNLGHGTLRLVPGLATATAALGAADIVAGNDSFGNKVMDAGAMGLGGIAGGMMGGPLGVAVGSSLGKGVSDATQAIFGGGKSAEERRMEEALLALRGGLI